MTARIHLGRGAARPLVAVAAAVLLAVAAAVSPVGTSVAGAATMPTPVPCAASQGSCWRPTIGLSWQWQLSCDVQQTCTNLSVKVPFYDIDWEDNPSGTVAAIHASGAHAYCYIDVGTWENWRADAGRFPASVLGNHNGWPGERWLDIRRLDVLGPIMTARMNTCRQKGFDGVQLDNVDGWQNGSGFPLTQQEDAFYTAWMANQAHERGLAASWENAVENAAALTPYMDALVMEQCAQYAECPAAKPMIAAGRWVGGVEYAQRFASLSFCSTYERANITGMFKKLSLNSYRLPCP